MCELSVTWPSHVHHGMCNPSKVCNIYPDLIFKEKDPRSLSFAQSYKVLEHFLNCKHFILNETATGINVIVRG